MKHMLKDSPTPVLRDVTVEDYAEVKNRGFIEGYYGNPWTKENQEDLMKYGGDLKLTQYYFAPKTIHITTKSGATYTQRKN